MPQPIFNPRGGMCSRNNSHLGNHFSYQSQRSVRPLSLPTRDYKERKKGNREKTVSLQKYSMDLCQEMKVTSKVTVRRWTMQTLFTFWDSGRSVRPWCSHSALPFWTCGCEDSNSARHPTHDTQMPPVHQTLTVPGLMGALCGRDGFVARTAHRAAALCTGQ